MKPNLPRVPKPAGGSPHDIARPLRMEYADAIYRVTARGNAA